MKLFEKTIFKRQKNDLTKIFEKIFLKHKSKLIYF